MTFGFPKNQGLYRSENERDGCGIGFVANIKGRKSKEIIDRGIDVLVNMTHRGAESADNKTGDGAGILIQIPHEFILSKGINVPAKGEYGTGLLFYPKNKASVKKCDEILLKHVEAEGLSLIDTRDVPVNSDAIGDIASKTEPIIKQIFVKGEYLEQDELERKLFMVRKLTENEIRESSIKDKEGFYIVSLSSKIFVYKGMLTPEQVPDYFLDLKDPNMVSAIALVHSRFSTNTFPTWDLAQPFRMIAHNGEINTIKGNRLWMQAREGLLKSDLIGNDLEKIYPIVEPDKSDSASFDNVLEFLVLSGKTMPHALSLMVPESWNEKNPIPESLKAFYEYNTTKMEPWDGPASIVFSDGRYIGGTLDRNGLRPSRYIITKDDMIVMGSEVGVQVFEPEQIKEKGRLRPGKILLVDTQLGIIIPDKEIKAQLTRKAPYQNWIKENRILFDDIKVQTRVPSQLGDKYNEYLKTFGYSKEDLYEIIAPMARDGKEPVGSMGNDTPIAPFSKKPKRLFNYFRQLFAQVTNPAIDPIREGLVMSLGNYIGGLKQNLLEDSAGHCKLIRIEGPVLTNTDLGKIKDLKHEHFTHVNIPMFFDTKGGGKSLEKALEDICKKSEEAVDNHKNFIILSDRDICKDKTPIPSLLAVSTVHHHLIRKKKRMQIGLIVETAEAREVMHFALLIGYGASIINPYGAFAVVDTLQKEGEFDTDYVTARKKYIKSINSGLLKIFSKMGISTLRSYHGSQIFEAIGLNTDVINKYFSGTVSRIEGADISDIAQAAIKTHQRAYETNGESLHNEGEYSYRKDGEKHSWSPETIAKLQWSTSAGDYNIYKEFSSLADDDNQTNFIRGHFNLKRNPIDIKEVEPVEDIMKRFVTGAMSYGSISKEAHEAIAIAMNNIQGRSNTGEGGEDPDRFKIGEDGLNRRSAIKQIASGRFGVNANYLVNADELQIKVSQGAKPGEGGQLPGHKVNKIIAKVRNSTPGITLISPPPHHDIYSIEDLAQLIFDLKCINPKATISVKLVSENGVGTIAAGVAKAHADLILISGCEGGTGASPISSVKHAGLPMELGLAETQQTLVMNNLRGRIKLQADGQLRTGLDVIKAGLLGAEEFGFATSTLIVLGCVMMRKCHTNTCPMGVATQNEELRKKFIGRHEYIENYFRFIAEEVREYLAELGFTKFDDIVGKANLLELNSESDSKVDLSGVLYMPEEALKYPLKNIVSQKHKINNILDKELISLANASIKKRDRVWITQEIQNTDRSVGTMLSGKVAMSYGEEGLPADTINCKFKGSAGQSFGAFLSKGLTFKLEGDSNDYLGKGLSGGKIIVTPPLGSKFDPSKNIIIGNTVLYGATQGEIYIKGVAGERFAVRNSGAVAVVEGVGDHCCEYMTGGRVVVLGETGRNFAAGMSGGIAYVLDLNGDFDYYCNKSMVELSSLDDKSDINELQEFIFNHLENTNSALAEKILTNWDEYLPKFVKVIPFEYKRILAEQKLEEAKEKIKAAELEASYSE